MNNKKIINKNSNKNTNNIDFNKVKNSIIDKDNNNNKENEYINNNKKEWEIIKLKNEENIKKLYENLYVDTFLDSNNNLDISQQSKSLYDSKNINSLLNNIQEFIFTLLEKYKNENIINKNSISNIINDIKNYINMIFEKNRILYMNQCYIINLVYDLNNDLNKNLKNFPLEIQKNFNVKIFMEKLKTNCLKLINDFKP
jgi:hypothetical protein